MKNLFFLFAERIEMMHFSKKQCAIINQAVNPFKITSGTLSDGAQNLLKFYAKYFSKIRYTIIQYTPVHTNDRGLILKYNRFRQRGGFKRRKRSINHTFYGLRFQTAYGKKLQRKQQKRARKKLRKRRRKLRKEKVKNNDADTKSNSFASTLEPGSTKGNEDVDKDESNSVNCERIIESADDAWDESKFNDLVKKSEAKNDVNNEAAAGNESSEISTKDGKYSGDQIMPKYNVSFNEYFLLILFFR